MDEIMANQAVYHELTYLDTVLRMLCAMLIGIAIGIERGRNHHPAGLRTHMLVALGSCVVVIVSHVLFYEFQPLGAMPDPARLGAQVISGVGFLGAGTIIREGLSIKGLTTAASLWTVACLGLAAGAGYYAIALTGAGAVYITLTVFEVVQCKMKIGQYMTLALTIECSDLNLVLHTLNEVTAQQNAVLSQMQFNESGQNRYHITALVKWNRAQRHVDQTVLIETLSQIPQLHKLEITRY